MAQPRGSFKTAFSCPLDRAKGSRYANHIEIQPSMLDLLGRNAIFVSTVFCDIEKHILNTLPLLLGIIRTSTTSFALKYHPQLKFSLHSYTPNSFNNGSSDHQ